MNEKDEPKIYLLPNLMTAGNLFCGFIAILSIFEAMRLGGIDELAVTKVYFVRAIGLILGACIFDVLDGRLARLGGQESDFGREFDSIADVVSFGLAPALLVMSVVLNQFNDSLGWTIAFFYLLCGAMRLARFNCVAAMDSGSSKYHFDGIPIPAAAGVISSLTLFMMWMTEGERDLGPWRYGFLILMVLLSFLMFSKLKYPSFKGLSWKTKRSIPWVLGVVILLVITVNNYQWMPALLFVLYLVYGLVRPWISKRWRKEIEEDMLSFESDGDGVVENGQDGATVDDLSK